MDVNQIIELAKKYQEKLNNLITSELFLSDLRKIEAEIKQNYSLLKNTYQIKQKFTAALERILCIRIPEILLNFFFISETFNLSDSILIKFTFKLL